MSYQELAERVEEGDPKPLELAAEIAKALHEAALGQEPYTIFDDLIQIKALVGHKHTIGVHVGKAKTPAAAWVAAILRAKGSEDDKRLQN